MKLTSNKGFSLVELMIVLAIISVIALISIPNLTKNVAKAKQKNAQVELSGVFTQEESFKAEYNTYHDNLPLIGFVPSGIPLDTTTRCPDSSEKKRPDRYYSVGFSSVKAAYPASVTASCNGSGAWFSFYPAILKGDSKESTKLSDSTMDAPNNTFTAAAEGYPTGSTDITDIWSIDQNRYLKNIKQGI